MKPKKRIPRSKATPPAVDDMHVVTRESVIDGMISDGCWLAVDSFDVSLMLLAMCARLELAGLSDAERAVIWRIIRALRKCEAAYAPGGELHGR